MKLGSALLLYSLAWSQGEDPESRFGLVISALEDIVKNIDNESKQEELAFLQFSAWCDAETKGLAHGAETARTTSERAVVRLRELKAQTAALEQGIRQQREDLKEIKDAKDQISSIREEEASKYSEEVDLNTQSVQTVEKALGKLSKRDGAFLQKQSLAPDSGYVLGLLKGIQERLNESRTELDRSEKAKRISHESLLGAKKEQSNVLETEVLEKTRLLQQAKVELIEAQRIYAEEQESRGEMLRMEQETSATCAAKAGRHEQHKADRKRERQALLEALRLLKQEGLADGLGASFLQMLSMRKNHEVLDEKENLRDAVALMQEDKEKAVGLGKAAEAVLGLVAAIQQHQKEDTGRKRFCEGQLEGSEAEKGKLQGAVARLKAREDYLSSETMSLSKELEGLKNEAAAYTERLSQLEEVRSRERMSYKTSSKDRELMKKVLVKAKTILEDFYKSKDPRNGLITASRSTWSLSSRSELGPSVLNLLDTIMADFKKEQSDAFKADEAAEQELEKARRETKMLFDKKLEHISKLLQEKVRDSEELAQVKADSDLKSSSLLATEDALLKLRKECSDFLLGFEKMADERQRQVAQLRDVADILSGSRPLDA